jgi:hypothetical protein
VEAIDTIVGLRGEVVQRLAARALIGLGQLANPEALIGIQAIAVLDAWLSSRGGTTNPARLVQRDASRARHDKNKRNSRPPERFYVLMQLNVRERGERSHIHIRRPSREKDVPIKASGRVAFPVAEGGEQTLPGFGLERFFRQPAE